MRNIFKKKKFVLKLFSVFSSFFIWLYVVSSAELVTSKMINIEIEAPKGLAIKNKLDLKVDYKIKGPGLFVRKFIDQEDIVKIAAKKYFTKNSRNFKLNLEKFQVKLPLGVTLVGMEPRYIDLRLEKKISKDVPLTIDLPEQLPLGAIVNIEPKSVKISGPRSLLNTIDKIELGKLPAFDLSTTKVGSIPVKTYDHRIEVDQKQVEYNYRIEKKVVEFTFSQIPIIFQSVNIIKKTSQKYVTVKVKGEKKFLEGIDPSIITVTASVPNNGEKIHDINLDVDLPTNLELLEINPSKIKVTVE